MSVSNKALFLRSPLLDGLTLNREKKGRKKRVLVAALVLTSLVDAFSILLLYLLVAGQNGTNSTLNLAGGEANLPRATQGESVESGTIVKVENGRYFIDGIEFNSSQIAQRLADIYRSYKPSSMSPAPALVIQADKASHFAALTPVIRAGSISGFNQFKFAVLQSDD